MGFDKSDGQPLVHLRKWGTKVNFAMALGIVVFLVLGFFAIGWMRSHKNKAANGSPQTMEGNP